MYIFRYICIHTNLYAYKILLWVNPSMQSSTTKPLAHLLLTPNHGGGKKKGNRICRSTSNCSVSKVEERKKTNKTSDAKAIDSAPPHRQTYGQPVPEHRMASFPKPPPFPSLLLLCSVTKQLLGWSGPPALLCPLPISRAPPVRALGGRVRNRQC